MFKEERSPTSNRLQVETPSLRRPRSPSPFAQARSHSLSSRRFSNTSLASAADSSKPPPAPRDPKRRGSSYENSQGDATMGAFELPPIATNGRPESVLSKLSSKESLAGSGSKPVIRRYEHPELISVDSRTDSRGGAPRRSHLSTGSTDSSNKSKSCSNHSVGGVCGHCERRGVQTGVRANRTPITVPGTVPSTPRRSSSYTSLHQQEVTPRGRPARSKFDQSETGYHGGMNRRSSSHTNLSRTGQPSRVGAAKQPSPYTGSLTRQRTVDKDMYPKTAQGGRRNSNHYQPPLTAVTRQKTTLNKSHSQPNLQNSRHKTAHHNNHHSVTVNAETSDADDGFKERIHKWMLGVDSAEAEVPEEPEIQEESPSQTDTAIHVIYSEER